MLATHFGSTRSAEQADAGWAARRLSAQAPAASSAQARQRIVAMFAEMGCVALEVVKVLALLTDDQRSYAVGCRGSYNESSAPLGRRIAATEPQPAFTTGWASSTPLPASDARVS